MTRRFSESRIFAQSSLAVAAFLSKMLPVFTLTSASESRLPFSAREDAAATTAAAFSSASLMIASASAPASERILSTIASLLMVCP